MPTASSSSAVIERIQQLLNERRQHEAAVAAIDEALAKISGILGTPIATAKPLAAPKTAPAVRGTSGPKTAFVLSAAKSILAFVKTQGNPTTAQIKENWASEGRTGQLSPIVAKLVKAGKLKRTPIPGQRGSRYSLR